MLNEQFIASIGTPHPTNKGTVSAGLKDAGIFIHEWQPITTQRQLFKKSATKPKCLAVSRSHIFAAQADKAVVHVFSREKGNQEATVPFPERITCLTLACDESVLVLGTAEGRIFLWEVASGRQLTLPQGHLQEVTSLNVDPSSNFMLSASGDSTVHVWSLLSILSFARVQPVAPLHTFAKHRSEVTGVAIGHIAGSCNFAVSIAKDKTCLVWDYHTNALLRTYLLPLIPTCVTLDPADRAVYVGYEDGSLQQIDLIRNGSRLETPSSPDLSMAPIQPALTSKWNLLDKTDDPVLCVSIAFDGYNAFTGHQSGNIHVWDVAAGRFSSSITQTALPGPVSNLSFLPVNGLPSEHQPRLLMHNIVKPRVGGFDSTNDGVVPGNYSVNFQLVGPLSDESVQGSDPSFENILHAPIYPQQMIDEGLSELLGRTTGTAAGQADEEGSADFMALDHQGSVKDDNTLEQENKELKAQLDALRRVQMTSFERMEKIDAERRQLLREFQRQENMSALNGVDESEDDGSE
ncbi:WD40 repeat-like protein [Polychaeton citri CBS 116435]|uniref:Pre-rRNA-processing protein IPI3 n=1 Tax=Polychaeton citri CBS 116435 TaxID=1314669 RepID=A0A9P4QGV7_9PEZI|nr:WD40 repeat-like protein [Polychaeton citri CBS 116435]